MKGQKDVPLVPNGWVTLPEGKLMALQLPHGCLVSHVGSTVMTWVPDIAIKDGKLVRALT